MKLTKFERRDGYWFMLTFENGETRQVDLRDLIGAYVKPEALHTARLDAEWGCLEFNDGMVDIAPATLYKWKPVECRLAA